MLFLSALPNAGGEQEEVGVEVGESLVKLATRSMASVGPGEGQSQIQKSQRMTSALVQEVAGEVAEVVDGVAAEEDVVGPEGAQVVGAVLEVLQSDWVKDDGLPHAARPNQFVSYLFLLPYVTRLAYRILTYSVASCALDANEMSGIHVYGINCPS